MSVSGKKEFDVKQILRLRWRWFSHPSQNATSPGVWLQQEGYEHRGTAVQNRLKNHSWDRSRLKKNSSPLHPNLLAPGPSLTPLPHQPASTCPQQNLPASLQVSEETPKTTDSPDLAEKREGHESSQELQMITEENTELVKRLSVSSSSSSSMGVNSNGADTCFHSANHAEQTFRKMENYLQQKQLCDVLLIAGEHKIPAHRLVLSAVSDYFAAMFTNDVREAKQEEVKMEGVDPDALKDLVLYAYTGMLELKEDTIESLLAAACLLQLSPVIEVCCNFLMKQLHPSNCLGIRSFGDAQGCSKLLQVAHVYTMEHFTEVIKNQEFLLLPAGEVAKLLSNDDINVPGEESIFKALMIWVQHDLDNRQHDLGMLLSYIRLPLLPPELLADLENSPMFTTDLQCQKLLMEAMKYHLLPERRSMMQSPRTKPRKSTVGSLYAVGGMDATKGVAMLEGPMYAVGGHDGWSYLNTVERWDPQARQWNYVASMSTPRSTVGVAALNSKLYAVGGRDGSSCLKSMECFDPHTNKWSICNPMSKRRGGVGVATYNGFLYAVGGHDAPASNHCSRLSDCVERYDPKTDTWTTVAPLSVPRDAVGICTLGDRLYAVGGYDGHTYLNTVESYDAQNNEWTEEVPVNVGRAGACVVVVKLP
ncbi:kelch-like protein 4 isoform X2 [Ahaetulla prasina]|uniref:kelch-like protein 4 isoform X2 n=1 Tax=Ahaetulla prasina TaxID=499056 RepID=UPI00264A23E5|nr:kelch-like protein 4 isoform X2 [Ahaetulla prasina]